MDSAASSSVIPLELADTYELQESPGSSVDQFWASATGELIPNVVQRTIAALTREGIIKPMTYQVAPVKKPLNAVCDIVRNNHTVVFDSEGSYIIDKGSGTVNMLREENGNYMLDVWALPATAVSIKSNVNGNVFSGNNSPGFQRQSR